MTSTGVLWLADDDGFAYTLSLEENKLTLRSEEADIIKRISAVDTCAFAVGGDQSVYLYVNNRDVPIRVQVKTYENQRWNPIHSWSEKSMLPTDRWSWSTQDGTKRTPKDSFILPENWHWEDEWYIDPTVPADEKGWQYALDFPREYTPAKEWKSCVRRRCWSRYRRFGNLEKWIKISSPATDLLVERAIQDIAIGGMAIPGCESGYIALWAVNFAGQVLYRQGITAVCPEGTSWVTIHLPEEVKAGQISVGPTGMVWLITWQGSLYMRTGISKFQPTGLSWVSVPFPDDRVYQLSVGTNALWLLSMEGNVYFRRGISTSIGYTDEESAKGTKWVEMVGSFSLISMALNDQVFALSTGSDHVFFRSDVTSSELSGKEWKILNVGRSMTDSMSSLSSDSSHHEHKKSIGSIGDDDTTLFSENLTGLMNSSVEAHRWNWISASSCNVVANFFNAHNSLHHSVSVSSINLNKLNLASGPWRGVVLELLESRDNDEMRPYCEFEQAVDKGSWSKSGTFRMLLDRHNNTWCPCKVTLANEGDVECLIIQHTGKSQKPKETKLMIFDITCISRVYNQTHTNCFTIDTAVRTMERNYLMLSALSEKELNEWMVALNSACQKARKCEGPPKPSALWCTTSGGDVFFSDSKDESDFNSLPAYHLYWRQVGGHLARVEAGVDHVVWGLGDDGRPWCFTRGFGGGNIPADMSSAHGICDQSDQDVFYTYENQRWTPWEGFGGSRLLTDRYEWSDETGVLERRKEGYPLPNSEWQWKGEWKVDFDTEVGTDRKGWMYALDFPREYSNEKKIIDCVRRRRWLRSASVNTTGPWVEILPSIPLRDVSIQIDRRYQEDGCIAVWAVGIKGDVLRRNGVTADLPQGESWLHVTTNTKFLSISVGCDYRVWGIGEDGAAYMRVGYEGNDVAGKMWDRIQPPGTNPLNTISVGKNTVWAVDKFGEHYYRSGVTQTFPEGVEWSKIFGRVQSVSVAASDEVWVKCQGGLEKCFKTSPDKPTGGGWVLALPKFWNSITARSVGIEAAPSVSDEAATATKTDGNQPLKQYETVKQQSYKDIMESGDIYTSVYGGEEFIPNSDDES
ncbi:tectonin beta-propeller repeat-containing protein 1-like [Dendronephthya gigantea]|uniref:tectonin beta-propeller repeat-containing protein 1-like n=1 Tax=Dendronephthya gigantea TaxID=151771 RepID=UPI0010699D64|nr:tectonin beta-propeller repeat-containing protein 1-like [Dendronephthya gigantea]